MLSGDISPSIDARAVLASYADRGWAIIKPAPDVWAVWAGPDSHLIAVDLLGLRGLHAADVLMEQADVFTPAMLPLPCGLRLLYRQPVGQWIDSYDLVGSCGHLGARVVGCLNLLILPPTGDRSWPEGVPPAMVDVPELPGLFTVDTLNLPFSTVSPAGYRGGPKGKTPFPVILEQLSMRQVGERNRELHIAVGKVGRDHRDGLLGIPLTEAVGQIRAVALQIGLGRSEIETTIRSGLRGQGVAW